MASRIVWKQNIVCQIYRRYLSSKYSRINIRDYMIHSNNKNINNNVTTTNKLSNSQLLSPLSTISINNNHNDHQENHQLMNDQSSQKIGKTTQIKTIRESFAKRNELKRAQRVVIKLGSAVITRDDECGLALGRLASIVEQVSELHKEGRDVLMVTSGAVAFGKQKLTSELRMSMSMRQTLSRTNDQLQAQGITLLEPRAAAAVGQSGLMALYDAMFAQYGITIAQILINKTDFRNPSSRQNLASTVFELLKFDIIPIINTNDAVVSPALPDVDLEGVISVNDNDILAAHLAVEVNSDALFILSDVNGIYTKPPSQDGARLLHTYDPSIAQSITFGEGSRVGTGGMESKVNSAVWALNRGVSVVICNGMQDDAISNIMAGKRVGTFFTQIPEQIESTQAMIQNARQSSRLLQKLTGIERGQIIHKLANLLEERQKSILEANERDLIKARASDIAKPLLDRLSLSESKLKSLSTGLRQIADTSETVLGRVRRRTRISNGLDLCQITVPLGVLLVIFESRPDCLPQIAALSIASGNGLLAKGGKEALESNRILHQLIQESLSSISTDIKNAVNLVSTREDVAELIQAENGCDLIIPRGSSELVRSIQEQSQHVPVLGHSEGICHVYIDDRADLEKAIRIVRDSKCDYPSACNAIETLLIHHNLVTDNHDFFVRLCNTLKQESVKLYSGPRLYQLLTFGPPKAKNLQTEYGGLEMAIEIVDDYLQAIDHINFNGSGHTDCIVTNDDNRAKEFLRDVDSACVFHNCSTRFSDGYRFGLGAEVGISTGRIHARGPVGIEGLLTTKWQLQGQGHVVQDFEKNGFCQYEHVSLPIESEFGVDKKRQEIAEDE